MVGIKQANRIAESIISIIHTWMLPRMDDDSEQSYGPATTKKKHHYDVITNGLCG